MQYEPLAFHIRGLTPTILHNGQLADPLNKWSKALKEITAELTPKQQDRTLEEELTRYQRSNPKFMDTVGAHGFEGVADVIQRANGTELGLLLDELRGTPNA